MNSAHGYTEGADVPQQPQAEKTMKTGIELISKEREEQIKKHSRTVDQDVRLNKKKQLVSAASALILCDSQKEIKAMAEYGCPQGWDKAIWSKMINKPYKERLIIAGALIAAEYDRVLNTEHL